MGNYDRKYSASPSYKWQNASLAAAAVVNVSWETQDATSKKYLPFNFTRIINNGEGAILFYPNQDLNNPIPVPAGTIISIDRTTIPALSSFSVENDSLVTISADKIIVTNSRQGQTADSIVERMHARLLNWRSGDVV